MADREKVIKGLMACVIGDCVGESCPYHHDVADRVRAISCETELLRDALALLKEQETHWVEETDRTNHYHCAVCGYVTGIVARMHKFCPECGRKVKWE